MCGIAGYFGTKQLNPETVEHCLSLMRRRGPDSAHFYHQVTPSNRNVYLLHSRLNIIDLSDRANQPFKIGSKVMIYNGELYNYLELKEELINRGHSIQTSSDTEILLRMLIEYGWEGLDRCEGMWAFAVYDEKAETLMFGRDRFSEKPLYLYQDPTGIYFGSEMKFISALMERSLDVNFNHLLRYMINGYKSLYKVKENFYLGVEEFQPGTVRVFDAAGRVKINERYWKPTFEQDANLTYREVVENVRELLIQSVRLRLRADVPLAFCMSGGVDSNSLISVAKKVLGYDVHGFTIVNTDARYEEQDMVDYSIRELGIRHTAIPVDTADFISKLRVLVKQHDAPVYTITYYAQWILMSSIAEHGYRISISGTGSDELFSGYYDHHLAYLYEVRSDHDLHRKSLAEWEKHVKPIVRNPYLGNPSLFFENPQMRDYLYLNSNQFAKYFYPEWTEPFQEMPYTKSLLRNRMLNEIFHESVPVILHEDDLNAMYYSIENRSPFLDRELFEFCSRIPTSYLIRDGFAKVVLRDAMKGIVPDRILTNHRKVGFNAPLFSFLDVTDPAVREYVLDDSLIFQYVRKDRIEQLLSKKELPNSESKFLFYFLNSKMFLEEALRCSTVKSA